MRFLASLGVAQSPGGGWGPGAVDQEFGYIQKNELKTPDRPHQKAQAEETKVARRRLRGRKTMVQQQVLRAKPCATLGDPPPVGLRPGVRRQMSTHRESAGWQ